MPSLHMVAFPICIVHNHQLLVVAKVEEQYYVHNQSIGSSIFQMVWSYHIAGIIHGA